jgi:5-methylthioadenosine/S-adenosylhomocysteine deaminase
MSAILLKNISFKDKPVDILIDGGVIKKISPAGKISNPAAGAEIADCTGMAAAPSFINMHTHAAMSLMRGVQEDVAFQEWLSNIWKIEAGINEEYVYAASKVAMLEMIKTGTTTFNDQYWHSQATHRAAVEMGLRPVTSYVVRDMGNKDEAEREKEQCRKRYEESLEWKDGSLFAMAFHAIYSVSEEMMLWASDFARKHGLRLHIHLSETPEEVEECKKKHGGLTPVEYLDRLGILDDKVIAAHTLWLSPHDIEILGERKVNCVHNINSNTKLASGYKFYYKELRDAGANVCIGTDGCASSNNLDILEAMKTSAIIQKAWRDDPKAWPLEELIDCATVNGAKALGLNTGLVKEGMLADLLIVDTRNSFFLSPGSFLANFVYSAHSDCIDSVICGGKFLMRGRQIIGEQEILKAGKEVLGIITK